MTYQVAYGFLYIFVFASIAVCFCFCITKRCPIVQDSNRNHLNNSRTNEVVQEISANNTMHHDPDDTTNDTTVIRDSITEEVRQPPSYEQVTLEDAIVLSRLELQEPPSYLVSSWDRCSKV